MVIVASKIIMSRKKEQNKPSEIGWLLFIVNIMAEEIWYRCATCTTPLVIVMFRRRNKTIHICPACTDYEATHFRKGVDGIFYEMTYLQRFANWAKDKPIRWFRKHALRRY